MVLYFESTILRQWWQPASSPSSLHITQNPFDKDKQYRASNSTTMRYRGPLESTGMTQPVSNSSYNDIRPNGSAGRTRRKDHRRAAQRIHPPYWSMRGIMTVSLLFVCMAFAILVLVKYQKHAKNIAEIKSTMITIHSSNVSSLSLPSFMLHKAEAIVLWTDTNNNTTLQVEQCELVATVVGKLQNARQSKQKAAPTNTPIFMVNAVGNLQVQEASLIDSSNPLQCLTNDILDKTVVVKPTGRTLIEQTYKVRTGHVDVLDIKSLMVLVSATRYEECRKVMEWIFPTTTATSRPKGRKSSLPVRYEVFYIVLESDIAAANGRDAYEDGDGTLVLDESNLDRSFRLVDTERLSQEYPTIKDIWTLLYEKDTQSKQ
jgi:hypothetical protein